MSKRITGVSAEEAGCQFGFREAQARPLAQLDLAEDHRARGRSSGGGVARFLRLALAVCCALLPLRLMAADLRAAMEADNARWLTAFNTPNPAAFPAMYTSEAVLLPQGTQPITGGPDAITQFWESRIKLGLRDHTFEIVGVHEDGKYAYQVAKWTVVLVKESGERTPLSGNTVRIFERQANGTWLTKVHIFNRHQ